jgi:hypothetical protein
MSIHTPIKDMQLNFEYSGVFYVKGSRPEQVKEETVYHVTLADTTGQIRGIIKHCLCDIRDGDFIETAIVLRPGLRFDHFAERPVIVKQDPPENIFDYINCRSEKELDNLRDEAIKYSEMIRDQHYNAVIYSAINDLDLIYALRTSPYKLSGSLAFPGGLLVHTTHSLRFARIACQLARDNQTPFNPGLVIAGSPNPCSYSCNNFSLASTLLISILSMYSADCMETPHT